MTGEKVSFVNGCVFDGRRLRSGLAACFEGNRLMAFPPEGKAPRSGRVVDLDGDILSPGFVDLQVNGGGGVMFNDDPSIETLGRIAAAHRSLGATSILPTLITDTAAKTQAAIAAAIQAVDLNMPGIAGLHLEGPHLSVARKGVHDAAFIRPMETQDLNRLLEAAARLPALMVTIAPENVREDQVARLHGAGVIVSLGHTDAGFDTCLRYARAGARCATHLFNAMSQFGNREPGLVGAALASGLLSPGLIADGIHVHTETMRMAWSTKNGPGEIFLVSDAMAVAGTELEGFMIDGRHVSRRDGRLTLSDGTLAGADLDLSKAIRTLVRTVGIETEIALRAATSVPASIIGRTRFLSPREASHLSDVVRLSSDLTQARPLVFDAQT